MNWKSPIQIAGPEPVVVVDQENKYLTASEQAATYRIYRIALMMFDAEEQILASYINANIFISRWFIIEVHSVVNEKPLKIAVFFHGNKCFARKNIWRLLLSQKG